MSTPTGANGASSRRTHTTSRRLRTASRLNPTAFAPFGQVIQNPATHGGQPSGLESVNANQGSAMKWLDVTSMHDFYEWSESGKRARVVMNMFVCSPRELTEMYCYDDDDEGEGRRKMVFPVKILERHPFTAQTFIPLGFSAADRNVRYLVIVAPTLPVASERDARPTCQTPGSTEGLNTISHSSPDARGSTPKPKAEANPTTPERKGPGPPDLDNIQAFIAYGDQAVTYGPGTWHAPMVVLGEKAIDFVVVQYSNGVAEEDCQEFEFETNDKGERLVVDVGEILGVKARL